MKQITFSDKQFYDLLQFTSEYVDNIIDRSVEYDDDLIIEENEDIINIHDFLCECKHKRLTLSPNEHIGNWTLQQTEEEAIALYNRGHYLDSNYVIDDMTYDHEFFEIREEKQ